MATANRPIQAISLANYTLDLKLLPKNTRSVTATTITATSGASEGATSLSVTTTAGVNYTIAAGTSLSFIAPSSPNTRQHVLLSANATLAGATTVTLSVAPLLDAIASNSTARLVQDMFPLFGVTNFGLQPSPTVVDTTNSQSQTGTSSAIVRAKREISVEGIEFAGDMTLEHFIKRPFFDPVYMNRELYSIATYPNGSKLEGASKVTALNLPGTSSDVMKYSFTLEFQDDCIWTPAYYATGGSSNGFPSYNL